MNPATLSAERKAEAEHALAEVFDAYPDVFGPSCWHEGPDYCDETPCSAIPPTVHRAAWVVCIEYSDLNPEGKNSLVTKNSGGCGSFRALGLLHAATDIYGG